MDLQITITLSDKLFELLENKLPNLGRRVEKAITKELGAQARKESNIALAVSPTVVKDPEPEASAQPVEEAPAPQPSAEAPALNTRERIRQIMHLTRQRFEGEDYKENTASEGYKKYHKQLTAEFKRIAAILGAEIPSKLPDDQVEAFATECEALIIGEDGNITPPPPTF